MAKKRSKSTQQLVSSLNSIISLTTAQESVAASRNGDNRVAIYHIGSSDAQRFLEGICNAIEICLHQSGTYKGYKYLCSPEDNSRKFCREYY